MNYKYRMHDPRVGRFFAIDPLAGSYHWNSPYAFSENRLIDGVELEGLEYATIIYKHFGNSKPVIEVSWFDDNQHNKSGSGGDGVKTVHWYFDDKGVFIKSGKTVMHKRGGTTNHGFYYGPKTLSWVGAIARYEIPGVDAVDEAGRIHDQAYDKVGADADNATKSWATIEADAAFIKSNQEVMSLGKGGVDPFNGLTITGSEVNAAENGALYFNVSMWSKIEDVSDWMEKNYPNSAIKANITILGVDQWDSEEAEYFNYSLFRNTYMEQNDSGQWIQKEGMWKEVTEKGKTYQAPKTPREL